MRRQYLDLLLGNIGLRQAFLVQKFKGGVGMKKWLLFFFFLFVISCDDLEKDNFSENGKIILEENQRKNEADNTITVKDYDSSAEYFVETDKMKISNLLSKILGIPIKEIKLSDTSIKFPISENKKWN